MPSSLVCSEKASVPIAASDPLSSHGPVLGITPACRPLSCSQDQPQSVGEESGGSGVVVSKLTPALIASACTSDAPTLNAQGNSRNLWLISFLPNVCKYITVLCESLLPQSCALTPEKEKS